MMPTRCSDGQFETGRSATTRSAIHRRGMLDVPDQDSEDLTFNILKYLICLEKNQVNMVIEEYRLPNDNVFIWLGTTDEVINDVLVLAGGDILFLKAQKTISLAKRGVKNDIMTLDCRSFAEKYKIPPNQELWSDLREKIESGEYPPFHRIFARQAFESMLRGYVGALLRDSDPKRKIEILDGIIGDCMRRRSEIEKKIGIKTQCQVP